MKLVFSITFVVFVLCLLLYWVFKLIRGSLVFTSGTVYQLGVWRDNIDTMFNFLLIPMGLFGICVTIYGARKASRAISTIISYWLFFGFQVFLVVQDMAIKWELGTLYHLLQMIFFLIFVFGFRWDTKFKLGKSSAILICVNAAFIFLFYLMLYYSISPSLRDFIDDILLWAIQSVFYAILLAATVLYLIKNLKTK